MCHHGIREKVLIKLCRIQHFLTWLRIWWRLSFTKEGKKIQCWMIKQWGRRNILWSKEPHTESVCFLTTHSLVEASKFSISILHSISKSKLVQKYCLSIIPLLSPYLFCDRSAREVTRCYYVTGGNYENKPHRPHQTFTPGLRVQTTHHTKSFMGW